MKKILYLGLLLPLALQAQGYTYPAAEPVTGQISVSGEATVYVVPDIIKVNFGIETKDNELAASQSENRTILQRAQAAFRELGLTDEDIKTDTLSVEPRYASRNNEDVFIGYYSRIGFVVTLTDKARLEQIVDAALRAGVNYVHSVDFQTSQLREHRDKAREMAVLAAREKAQSMATALGARLGPPLRINENGRGGWYYAGGSGWARGGAQRAMLQNSVAMASDSSDSGGEIQLGKIAVQASVSVDFSLVTLPMDQG